MNSPGKILIQAIGNPARGDDAVGPIFVQRLAGAGHETEWVYQLQIEHSEQWSHYDTVIVVDAHASQREPIVFSEITPSANPEISSHSVRPESVLALNRAYFSRHPRVFTLSFQSEAFDLGAGLSTSTSHALDLGLAFMRDLLSGSKPWPTPVN